MEATTTTEQDETFECEGCGEEFPGEGNSEMIRRGTLEEPPEYVTICDGCLGNAEPDYDDYDDYDHRADVDYAYDPFYD